MVTLYPQACRVRLLFTVRVARRSLPTINTMRVRGGQSFSRYLEYSYGC